MEIGICLGIFIVIMILSMIDGFFKDRKRAENEERFRLTYQDLQKKFDAVSAGPPLKEIFCHSISPNDYVDTQTYYLGSWNCEEQKHAPPVKDLRQITYTYTFSTQYKVTVYLCRRCARKRDTARQLVIKHCPSYDIIGDITTLDPKERTRALVSYVCNDNGW